MFTSDKRLFEVSKVELTRVNCIWSRNAVYVSCVCSFISRNVCIVLSPYVSIPFSTSCLMLFV